MTDDQKLTALLRLKRYEQPPAGYYERLLQDIHRRQRSELLRRPLWAIGLERLQTFFSAHSMGSVSFAGAMAIIALTGLLGISMIGEAPEQHATAPVRLARAHVAPTPANVPADTAPAPRLLSLQESPIVVIPAADEDAIGNARLIPTSISPQATATQQPRYVIDARPVSVEAAKVSFSF